MIQSHPFSVALSVCLSVLVTSEDCLLFRPKAVLREARCRDGQRGAVCTRLPLLLGPLSASSGHTPGSRGRRSKGSDALRAQEGLPAEHPGPCQPLPTLTSRMARASNSRRTPRTETRHLDLH